MKIAIRKYPGYFDDELTWIEQKWGWIFRADNGAGIADSLFNYHRRTDAIHGAMLVTGLTLPERPKGCKSQRHMGMVQPRGGVAEVYASYPAEW